MDLGRLGLLGWAVDQSDPSTATCSRWANHHCGGGNAMATAGWAGGRPVVFLAATRFIPAHAEVLWDYGCSWNAGDAPLKRCVCGYPMCRGFIGSPSAVRAMKAWHRMHVWG